MRSISKILPRLASLLPVVLGASLAAADPDHPLTQDEVFRSINQNVNSSIDVRRMLPFLLCLVATIILIAVITQFRRRRTTPGEFNHIGKLMKEVSRSLHLRASEIKQLKILADEMELESPLTLLLCPSLLGKSLRSKHSRVDRAVVEQVVARLRAGLVAHRGADETTD